jgi:hypothetical protein
MLSTLAVGQNKTATTEDGKKVILKNDKTWDYADKSDVETKRKITLEFTSKNTKKQFQVVYDAPDSQMINSGNQIGGFYNSGWKKSFYVIKMENQITFKVGNSQPNGSEIVTLNIYIDDKLVKSTTEKAEFLVKNPATLTVNLEDYK